MDIKIGIELEFEDAIDETAGEEAIEELDSRVRGEIESWAYGVPYDLTVDMNDLMEQWYNSSERDYEIGGLDYNKYEYIECELPSDYEVKEDGSLDETGVEIASPILYDTDDIESFLSNVYTLFNDNLWNASDGCGMHVHVDAEELTTAQWYRIYRFMNNPKWDKHIEDIAGRVSDQWAHQRYDKKWLKDTDENFVVGEGQWGPIVKSARYQRVVQRVWTGTYEFRLFAASDTVEIARKKVYYIIALVKTARETNRITPDKVLANLENVLELQEA